MRPANNFVKGALSPAVPHVLISLAQIARRFPGSKGAENSHPATWIRWILRGCLGAEGLRHKLKATRIGSRWLVTEVDVAEFFDRLSALGENARDRVVPPADRARQIAAACREMKAAGA